MNSTALTDCSEKTLGNLGQVNSKCALECTGAAIAVYWACAGVCIKKQASNSCILDGCPAAVTAFDIPCLSKCKTNTTENTVDNAAAVKSSPPCHYTNSDYCKETSDNSSCEMDWEKSGDCNSVGFPVCCKGHYDIELWFKSGTDCSKEGRDPMKAC